MAERAEWKSATTLSSSEARLRAILAAVLDAVVVFDARGIVQEASASVRNVFGWEPGELVGRNLTVLMGEPHRALDDDFLARHCDTGAATLLDRTREVTMVRKNGTPFVCELSLSPVEMPGQPERLFAGSFRDVTLVKDAQQRESHMLKALAAIGESASVLVHEIKTPITGIHLAIQAVADQLGEDAREILSSLEGSLQKIERTMRRTLSFAKPLDLKRQPVDVSRLIDTVARRARTELAPSTVALETDCEADLPVLDADEALLEEVLYNLVKNALEALDSGGRVRMTARRSGERMLELTVEDDGFGIPGYVRPNAFKPFYTTKEQGTGIGLALCKKIVDAHGGEIDAGRSSLGGAGFTIRMPLA